MNINNFEDQENSSQQEQLQNMDNLEIIPQIPLTQSEIDHLIDQAKEFQLQYDQFTSIPFDQNKDKFYYLLSTKFLKRWKAFVSYDQVTQGQLPSKYIGGPKIVQKINQDLMDPKFDQDGENPERILLNFENLNGNRPFSSEDDEEQENYTHYNAFIRNDLQEEGDFIFINSQIWDFFKNLYDDYIEIKREVYINVNGTKKIEVQLQKNYFIIVCNQDVKKIDMEHAQNFTYEGYLQFSHYLSVNQLTELLETQIYDYKTKSDAQSSYNNYNNSLPQISSSQYIRLWVLDQEIFCKQKFFKYVQKEAKEHTSTKYSIKMEGKIMQKQKNTSEKDVNNAGDEIEIEDESNNNNDAATAEAVQQQQNNNNSNNSNSQQQYVMLDEYDLIESDIIIIDIEERYNSHIFYNHEIPRMGQCEECRITKILEFPCCKKASYCSQSCKEKDFRYHEDNCEAPVAEGNGPSLAQDSVKGVCGLNNIGNTCFMNSGIQCLSQCYELINYFLSDRYINDLNIDAPLGTKGELTKSFAIVAKNLWYGAKQSYNPRVFKKILSQYHQIFQGYNQHDSQELLTEVLSSFTEDLNLIKKKVFKESEDSDGPKEYWNNFISRNNSILSYLINGQFKSQLKCPDCEKIFITYDPYLMISLPIPIEGKQKSFSFIYIHNDEQQSQYKIQFTFDKAAVHTVKDINEEIQKQVKLNINPDNIFSQISTDYSFGEVVKYDTQTSEIRKSCKYKTFTARQLTEREIKIPKEEQQEIDLINSKAKWANSSFKQKMIPIRRYIWNKNDTLKQLHLDIFKMVKHFLKGIIDPTLSDEQNYEKCFDFMPQQQQSNEDINNNNTDGDNIEVEQQQLKQSKQDDIDENTEQQQKIKIEPPYILTFESKVSYSNTCSFCGYKNCRDCKLPYSDQMTIQQLQDAIDKQKYSSYSQNDLEIEIQWEILGEGYTGDIGDFYNHFEIFEKNVKLNYAEIQQENKAEQKQQNQAQEDMETEEQKDNQFDVEPQQSQNQKIQIQEEEQKQQNSGQLTLYTCLKHFSTPEKLDEFNEVYCRNCKDHKQMEKQLNIQTMPLILIFQFKRFYRKNPQSAFMKKINSTIDFPLTNLDLTDYVIDSNLPGDLKLTKNQNNSNGQKKEKVLYDLFAVSNHSGSLLGGHYTAYGKNAETNKWYYYNDSSVSKVVNEDEIISNSAYVLFYRRQNAENLTQEEIQQILYQKLYNETQIPSLQNQIQDINIQQQQQQQKQ